MNIFTAIYNRWNVRGWIPPLNTLQHHATHMGGGASIVLLVLAISFAVAEDGGHFDLVGAWCYAALISASLFTLIEFMTWFFKHNLWDSLFDWVQYQFHWMLYALVVGGWVLFTVVFAALLAAYFCLLLRGPGPQP